MFRFLALLIAFVSALFRPATPAGNTRDFGRVALGSAFRLVDTKTADTGRISLGSAFRLAA